MNKKQHKKKKIQLTAEQKKECARQRAEIRANNVFIKKFYTIFKLASFVHINSNGKHFEIGNKTAEIDNIFVFKNIIVVCEDTTTAPKYIKDHILVKKETADEIIDNKSQFIDFLCNSFPNEAGYLKTYVVDELKFKFIYFSRSETQMSIENKKRFEPWYIVEPDTLSYLYQCAIGIKKSVKYEVLRFLGVKDEDFEISSSTGQGTKDVRVSIIYPQKSTGRTDGVRLVSFMLSAETLIRNSYVLRKDNWEDSIGLYQRLIDLKKIKDIRQFLYNKGECFYNNIIVALPNGVKFTDSEDKQIPIDNINSFQNCTMHIPNKMNSICVIDGQHRIYAHFEGEDSDPMESKISQLRERLHLLVTGLIFPEDMSQTERIKIQSEIFAEINTKAKAIPPDVLLHIEMLRDPLSDIGLARQLLEKLNKTQLFLNYFEFSPLKPARLKVASIIKFALRYLVALNPGDDKASLYTVWDYSNKQDIFKDNTVKIAYIEYCIKYLTDYFSAIRQIYSDEWFDSSSKLLSVITFNSFILALKKDLLLHGNKARDYYLEHFSKHKFDFSNENFLYTSSQYNKFSDEIIDKCFG